MYLDYAKIKKGQRKQPMLRLRNLSGMELGPVPYVYDLKFEINYADLSKITFTIPYQVNGKLNPLYAAVSSFKTIYTEEFGIYVLTAPDTDGNGISETKTVMGYSLEYQFQKKNLFLEEGTYNFWNPGTPADTILGRIVELDPTWRVGYVAPRLIGCYRTFDQYDSDALSFCYSDAMEKYRCAIVFDVYQKTINAYDANENAATIPIYLSYENLVSSVKVSERSEDMATKLHLYGSDGLTIRDVNPTGTDYIVNLDYFLSKGDLDIKVGNSDKLLSVRVKNWQAEIAAQQPYYTGLVSSRASVTAQKLAAESDLTKLNGDLDGLTAQQSVIIQAFSLETTDDGKKKRQGDLDEINAKIAGKKAEIEEQQSKINGFQSEIDGLVDKIKQIVDELALTSYFSKDEQNVLNQYLIDGNVEDETFVATEVDTNVSGIVQKITGSVSVSGADIMRVAVVDFNRTMYMVSGGAVSIADSGITAEIIRATLDIKDGNSYVFTASLGATKYNERTFGSGLLTISGTLSRLTSDVSAKTENEVTEYKGTKLSFSMFGSDSYFTVNATEFQRYSVAMDLYDFGSEVLDDCAWPVYEFSIESANFLYHKKFEPFKNKLELGKAVHLNLGSEGHLNAKIIGATLDFENISNFTLLFSNQYQRKNRVKNLIDEIKSVSRTSRNINASKHTYNRTADKVTQVDQFISALSRGAADIILSSSDQTIVADSTGLHIGGNSNYQMRVTDKMFAMTDDGWKTAKVGIGLYAHEGINNGNPIWGVNTELLAGKLLIGNNLILQNLLVDEHGNVTGTMMFQVDATGAWLYNSRIVLQGNETARGNDGGLMILDPKYGIVAGTKLLFDTNGTTVTPEFMDEAGDITFDSDGMPQGANFFLDIRDGSAYFRGNLKATSGRIGGFTIEDDYLHAGGGGSYVAINGSGSNANFLYAFWAGAENPGSAPFSVKKNGDLYAKNGTFKGIVSGASYLDGSGNPMMNDDYQFTAGYLNINGLNVGHGNFVVDANGNVSMKGKISMSPGSSIDWENVTESNLSSNSAYSLASTANSNANSAKSAADAAYERAEAAYKQANSISFPSYIQSTYIDTTTIKSPVIEGGEFYGGEFNVISNEGTGSFNLYGDYASQRYHMFTIDYTVGISPRILIYSPAGGYIDIGKDNHLISFFGDVDFGSANVRGLNLTTTPVWA